MKKLLMYILLIASTAIYAQELDESFLDSLPDSIKDDVLDKVKTQKANNEPVYRNTNSKIDKDSLDEIYLLEDEDDIEDEKSKIFGSDFFNTIQTSFMPINEPNLDALYVLDFGDILEIQLIGQENSLEDYPIRRDGTINISDIGKITLSGLSLGEASELIKEKVKNSFIGTKAYVSLSNIRDIGVLIAGNAFQPGIYTLNGNSNILHALSMAGGINEIGSYRDISLIRNNNVVETLDVYDVLISGKTNFNKRLRSGDTILVNPSKKVVSIESGVLRPGNYELKDGETYRDLIRFANGISSEADTTNIVLKRAENGESKVININFNNIDDYDVKRGDSLFIREYKFNTVTIEGAVKNPGKYLLPLGTKLSELIISAGGYEESAYPFGGYLNNQRSLEINENSKDRLYNEFLNAIVRNASMISGAQESLGLVLKQLKEAEATGRIIAEFDLDVLKASPEKDTILEDNDEIVIPLITQQVFVQGDVSNPGAIRYRPNESLDFYINGSGGLLETADNNNIFVIHPNGESQNLSKQNFNFLNANNTNQIIYPGSIIFVPKSFDPNTTEIASIWAPIISSIALSLTSLSVLNNN